MANHGKNSVPAIAIETGHGSRIAGTANAANDGNVYFTIKSFDTPYIDKKTKRMNIAFRTVSFPAGTAVIPAMGSKLTLRNARTGERLGTYIVVPDTEKPNMVWHAPNGLTPVTGTSKPAQRASQPATATAVRHIDSATLGMLSGVLAGRTH
jgi:hypothetical protein